MRQHDLRRRRRAGGQPLRLLALALAIAASARCSDGATAPVEQPITGSYRLADVGGNRLPTTVYEGPYTVNGQRTNVRIDVVGGALQLESERYTIDLQLRLTVQGQSAPLTISDEGRYARNGGRVAFQSDDAEMGSYAGDVNGGAVTVSIDLMGDGHPPVYAFRR